MIYLVIFFFGGLWSWNIFSKYKNNFDTRISYFMYTKRVSIINIVPCVVMVSELYVSTPEKKSLEKAVKAGKG